MRVKRSWFRQITSVLRISGTVGGVRLKEGDEPNQETFDNLEDSAAFHAESDSRARVSTGGGLEVEQGLVVLASDAQVKSASVQPSDRSIVVQPHQLPTVKGYTTVNTVASDQAALNQPEKDALVAKGFDSETASTIVAGVVSGVNTRNEYGIRLSNTVLRWLSTVADKMTLKAGGLAGMIYKKSDNGDYNAGWSNYGYNTTVNSTMTIAVGELIIGIDSGFDYKVGTRVRVAYDDTHYMEGQVTEYAAESLVLAIDSIKGAGTFSQWDISLGGDKDIAIISGSKTTISNATVDSIDISYRIKGGIVYLFGRITFSGSPAANTVTLFTDVAVKSPVNIGVTVNATNYESIETNTQINVYMNASGQCSIKTIGELTGYANNIYNFTMSYPSI